MEKERHAGEPDRQIRGSRALRAAEACARDEAKGPNTGREGFNRLG
jgi:hypothetical protein